MLRRQVTIPGRTQTLLTMLAAQPAMRNVFSDNFHCDFKNNALFIAFANLF